MALGDGITWVETGFTNASEADTIDNETTDIRIGVRSRLAIEHEWPAAQTGTSEGGVHKYITLQSTTAPSALVAGTQRGAIALGSSGTGYEVFVGANISATTAGDDIQLTQEGRSLAGAFISTTGDSTRAGAVWFRSDL